MSDTILSGFGPDLGRASEIRTKPGHDATIFHGLVAGTSWVELVPELRLISVLARDDHWKRVRTAWQVPVLRRLLWATMTFEQIDRKLRSLPHDPALDHDVLAQLAAWVAG